MPDRPEKLAIVAPKNAFSLGIVQVLSSIYRVELWDPDEEVVASFREARPPLVLVVARFHEIGRRGELARRLKTEMRPPKVALVARSGLPVDAPDFLGNYRLDGLWGGEADATELLEFVEQVFRDEKPIVGRKGNSGRARKVLKRLSGWSVFSRDG